MSRLEETGLIGVWQGGFLKSYRIRPLILGILLLVGGIGCKTIGGAPVPPCPVPSDRAYEELDTVAECCPGIVEYLGRVELLCNALEEMKDG